MLLVLCSIVMIIEGFDIYMIGQIAPAIAQGLGEDATGFIKVFLLQQVGLAVGGFVVSPFSDQYGRKPLLIFCAIAFGLLTLAALAVTSLLQLAALRGLAGLFLAGVVPNALALLTETTPARHRSTFVAIAFAGFVLGSGLAALIALFLLGDYGWQSCFVIGGLLPLLCVPLCILFVDESVPFMLRRNSSDVRIAPALYKIAPDVDLSATLLAPIGAGVRPGGSEAADGGLGRVFAPKWIGLTLLLWGGYFLSVGEISMLASWSTTFFNKLAGVSVQAYAATNLLYVAGSLIGTVSAGFLLDRFRRTQVMLILPLVAVLAVALVGSVPFGGAASKAVFFAWGFSQNGAQSALNVICALAYPTAIRSTGVGWSFAMGRVGSIVGPLLGGGALAFAFSLQQIYFAAAAAQLIIAIFMLALARRLAKRLADTGGR